MQTGYVQQKSTVVPALEGTVYDHCQAITCLDGMLMLGSSAYRAPGLWIKDCHLANHRKNIYLEDVNQAHVIDNLIYNYANSIAGVENYSVFTQLNRVSDCSVINNK